MEVMIRKGRKMKMTSRRFIESREEMEKILGEETIGYLGLSMNGESYVVPLNYAYVEGKILFHCALTGKKLDYLRENSRVCFTVGRQFGQVRRHAEGGPCHVDNDSVICYGKGRVIEDGEERRNALNRFNRYYQPTAEEISMEAAAKCYAVEIEIAGMTGRREREEGCTYWKYCFEK